MANRNVEDLTDKLYFGNGNNRSSVDVDGTVRAEGDATCWEDIKSSLIGKRLTSTAGKVDVNWSNNTVTFQRGGSVSAVNDRVIFNYQYPHAAVINGMLKLHIHWEQVDATDREFTIQYRIQNNGSLKNTTWTTDVISSNANNVFTYTSGTLIQITSLSDIDMTGASISSQIQFRMARTDSVNVDLEATYIDAHYERDMLGSKTEYVK